VCDALGFNVVVVGSDKGNGTPTIGLLAMPLTYGN
jgi:hypothetical protein